VRPYITLGPYVETLRFWNQYDCKGGLKDRWGTNPETRSKVLRNGTNSFTLGFRAALIPLLKNDFLYSNKRFKRRRLYFRELQGAATQLGRRVLLILWLTHSTLNIMSLMGVIVMTGIVISNSILIVEFSGILHARGMTLVEAVVEACKVRLCPILMTSLATLLGLIPLALGSEAGSEQDVPLARAIIGGLAVSVVTTVFLVPAVYIIVHGPEQAVVEEAAS
jgi:hypothetical protein